MRKNKKGAELSMNVVIITILAVLVLVVVAIVFTGNMGVLVSKIKGLFQSQGIDAQKAVADCYGFCNSYRTTGIDNFKDSFCNENENTNFDIDTNGDGKIDLYDQDCADLNVPCAEITC